MNRLLLKNNFKESEVRIVLTGGGTKNGMNFNSSTFYILIEESKKMLSKLYNQGVKLVTFEHKREIPMAKTLNYISAIHFFNMYQKKQNFFEILYTYNSDVLECSTSNFFIFRNNKLITAEKDILLGTTRNFVLKLAKKSFKIEERRIKKSELRFANEAFITATNKDIIPVIILMAKK